MSSFVRRGRAYSALVHSFILTFIVTVVGCSPADDEEPGGDGDGVGTGGQVSTGGNATGGAGSGGLATGGVVGTGGAATGGSGTGGFATGGFGTGGGLVTGGTSGTGGDFGTGGDVGTGGGDQGTGGASTAMADPSPGCSNGSSTFSISGGNIGLPDGYDGSTPYPVIFAFHAAGNDASQLENHFGNTVLADDYVMVYLQASGSGWNYGSDVGIYDSAHDQVLNSGCVDMNSVYALGHSSGAQMIVQLLCQGNTDFDGVVPVASSVYCGGWDDSVPVLNIHGTNDQERCAYGLDDCDGAKDIVPYRDSNSCEATTMPADLDVGSSCSGDITPNCMEFQGCDEPTFWCNHNDPQYGTSNHGIPCFATDAISDFFSRL